MGLVGEALLGQPRLVAEAVLNLDRKLDRFRAEVADEFRQMDPGLLRLEARVLG